MSESFERPAWARIVLGGVETLIGLVMIVLVISATFTVPTTTETTVTASPSVDVTVTEPTHESGINLSSVVFFLLLGLAGIALVVDGVLDVRRGTSAS